MVPPTASTPIAAATARRVSTGMVWSLRGIRERVPLVGVVDLIEGGVDHPVGQLVGALDEEGAQEAVELTLVGHRSRPPATATGRSSASMAARIARWA